MSLLVAVQDIEQTQELLIRHVEAYKTESSRCQMVSTIGRLGAEMRSNIYILTVWLTILGTTGVNGGVRSTSTAWQINSLLTQTQPNKQYLNYTTLHWHVNRTSEWVHNISTNQPRCFYQLSSSLQMGVQTWIRVEEIDRISFNFQSPVFQFVGTDGLEPGRCHVGITWITIEGN